jgi:hypothetical protein
MKELVKFNVKNIKYATPTTGGVYTPPVAYGSARSIALESDTNIKDIYGDGLKIASIVNDKGKTGSFTTNAISTAYEIAMGRKKQLATGLLADIKQAKSVDHAIYFETEALDEETGAQITAKTLLFGVVSSRPSESFDQTENDINESTFETSLSIKGVELTYDDGSEYRDENGNKVFVWQVTATKDAADYDTFGDEVVLPTMPKV